VRGVRRAAEAESKAARCWGDPAEEEEDAKEPLEAAAAAAGPLERV
jgi:hypothetical protein